MASGLPRNGKFGRSAACLLGGPVLAAILAFAGCAPAPPPPTLAKVQLTAAADVNPGADGNGAPVAIRIYQLGAKAGRLAGPTSPNRVSKCIESRSHMAEFSAAAALSECTHFILCEARVV